MYSCLIQCWRLSHNPALISSIGQLYVFPETSSPSCCHPAQPSVSNNVHRILHGNSRVRIGTGFAHDAASSQQIPHEANSHCLVLLSIRKAESPPRCGKALFLFPLSLNIMQSYSVSASCQGGVEPEGQTLQRCSHIPAQHSETRRLSLGAKWGPGPE